MEIRILTGNTMQYTHTSPTEYPQFKFFFILLALFTATWLTSDIAAIKLVSVFGITLTGGFIIFPLTTLFGSIIVEVYGYKNARQAIWAGFILNFVFFLFINIVALLPSSPYWQMEKEFRAILLPETRIAIASLISFFIAEFINNYLMAKMKLRSHGKSLVKRIIFSSIFSFFIDVGLFLTLAFYGRIPNTALTNLILFAYLKKLLCQIIIIPIALIFIRLLKNKEGVETYDYDTEFNPFSLDNVYDLRSFTKTNFNIHKNVKQDSQI